jgi:DNA-directed RNA polymerase subunit RPC12/RpoP
LLPAILRNYLLSCSSAAKVRDYINCAECGKRRVIYGRTKLGQEDMRTLERMKQDLVYTCGAKLCDSNDLVVREGLNCASMIETTYFAGTLNSFF